MILSSIAVLVHRSFLLKRLLSREIYINALIHSSKTSDLEINVSKSISLCFCSKVLNAEHVTDSPYIVGNECIRFTSSHSDLGVTIDLN